MQKAINKTAKFIIPVLLLGFLSLNISQNLDLILSYWKNFDLFFLSLGLFFMLAVFIEAGLNWHELLKRLGYPLPFKKSLYIFIVSNASRYIPGSIWQYISRVELAKKIGNIPRKGVILSLVLEIFILVNAALVTSILALPYLNQAFLENYFWILIIPLSLIFFHPAVFKFCLKIISKITKKEIGNIATIKPQEIILTVPFFISNFLLNGFALFFLTKAIYPQVSFESILFFSGVFAFAWAVGFLSIFAPAGLGVTDLILAYLLSFQMPFALASTVALSYRVFLSVAEMIVFIFVMKIRLNSDTSGYTDTARAWEERSRYFGKKVEGVATKSLPTQINKELDDWMLERIKKIAKLFKEKSVKVVDLGCGYGRLSKPLLENYKNFKIYGIDVSKNYVNLYNRDLKPRGKALVGDIKRLPFKDNSIDIVFMVTTLMYLTEKNDRKMALNEIIRVLKPSGRSIIIERNPSGYYLFTLGGLVSLIRGKRNKEITAVSINKNELIRTIRSAGGKVDEISGIPFLSLFLLPSVMINKLNSKMIGFILNPIILLDKKIKFLLWPSLYLSYTISKPASGN